MRYLATLSLIFLAFSDLNALEETVVGKLSLEPGQQAEISISTGDAELIGWKLRAADILETEKVAECPDSGCILLSYKSEDSVFSLGGRYGSLGKAPSEQGMYLVKNIAPFPADIDIITATAE